MRFPSTNELTPSEFELTVKRWFESFADSVDEFEANHLESIQGLDGEFEFDVTLRFTAFGGANMLCICECKKHKNPIKRDVIQTLHAKLQSVGAHKGFVIATAKFQAGAKEYAFAHGIALIQITNGNAAYIVASARPPIIPDDADPYCGMIEFNDGTETFGVITTDETYFLETFLKSATGQSNDKNGSG